MNSEKVSLLSRWVLALSLQGMMSVLLLASETDVHLLLPRKNGLYKENGVFYFDKRSGEEKINRIRSVRHYYTPKEKMERIVLDMEGQHLNRVYTYISQKEKKIYIDMSHTTVSSELAPIGSSSLVKDLVFFPIDQDLLSFELHFKDFEGIEAFYLENPLRFVLDIRSK
jgi:hypothetical protein